jgi:ABC-type uncharacterized transport system substrate-binding protein
MNGRLAAFILALATVIAPLVAEGQQPGKVWRLGVLSPGVSPGEAALGQSPLIQKLSELGYTRNQNLIVEYRFAEGMINRLPDLAAELVQLKVDAIYTFSSPGVQAARKATGSIPIVFVGVNDPVGLELVTSLARPGGNVTGISTFLTGDLVAKQLQILKEVVPRVSRVATLWNPANLGSATALKETQTICSRTRHQDRSGGDADTRRTRLRSHGGLARPAGRAVRAPHGPNDGAEVAHPRLRTQESARDNIWRARIRRGGGAHDLRAQSRA